MRWHPALKQAGCSETHPHAVAPSFKTGRLFLKPILKGYGEGERFTGSLLSG